VSARGGRRYSRGGNGRNIPFVLQSVAEFEDLNLYLALAVVLEDFFVGLALALFDGVVLVAICAVGFRVLARSEVGEVALDVAGGAGAAGGAEADIVGCHLCVEREGL
jgi:hypothetical protein